MRFCSRLALAASIAVIAACVPAPKPKVPPAPPPPENAVAVGVTAGPAITIQPSDAQRLYNAFIASCPAMLKRADTSGLTRPEDWQALCQPLDFESPEGVVEFFHSGFQLVQVGDGSAFATGYYEPQISGSRVKAAGFEVPVYAKPADLLAANPATGEKGRGRVDKGGNYVLYHDRAAIEDGALAGKGLEIAWAADPIDLFFLQIQGSGQLLLPDGGVMRIGYADQNGREYVAIGKLLKERGLITGAVSMQAITDWLRANPEQGRALMRENKSYVFFRELTGPGPLGAMGVAVTPKRSVAADPRFIPLGAPVLLDLDYDQADGFWVAQDTGGAIKGANRFDTFWGAGQGAAAISGGLQARGRAYVMLPNAAVARLLAGRNAAQTQR
nr:murein transglycosylase A [Allosphingosinicella vermicomposti]